MYVNGKWYSEPELINHAIQLEKENAELKEKIDEYEAIVGTLESLKAHPDIDTSDYDSISD